MNSFYQIYRNIMFVDIHHIVYLNLISTNHMLCHVFSKISLWISTSPHTVIKDDRFGIYDNFPNLLLKIHLRSKILVRHCSTLDLFFIHNHELSAVWTRSINLNTIYSKFGKESKLHSQVKFLKKSVHRIHGPPLFRLQIKCVHPYTYYTKFIFFHHYFFFLFQLWYPRTACWYPLPLEGWGSARE